MPDLFFSSDYVTVNRDGARQTVVLVNPDKHPPTKEEFPGKHPYEDVVRAIIVDSAPIQDKDQNTHMRTRLYVAGKESTQSLRNLKHSVVKYFTLSDGDAIKKGLNEKQRAIIEGLSDPSLTGVVQMHDFKTVPRSLQEDLAGLTEPPGGKTPFTNGHISSEFADAVMNAVELSRNRSIASDNALKLDYKRISEAVAASGKSTLVGG